MPAPQVCGGSRGASCRQQASLRLRDVASQDDSPLRQHPQINSHNQCFSTPTSHPATEVSTQWDRSLPHCRCSRRLPTTSFRCRAKKTHSRIALRRSGISLGKRVQGTLSALGLRRRMQTVYHPHTPEAAGMILAVKELVEVQNVSASAVRTAGQQRAERKAPRGFTVVGSKVGVA